MNTTLHVTVDKQTKVEAAKLAKELGFDLSSFIKASLKLFHPNGKFLCRKRH